MSAAQIELLRLTKAEMAATASCAGLTNPAAPAVPAGWQPIETAPRDGTPILGFCVHDDDPCYLEDRKRLTTYGAHTEGLSHVDDGPNILVWGGGFDDSTWEAPGAKLPDWWFLNGSDFEVTANPILWMPLPAAPAVPVLPKCHVAVIGHRWDGEALHHIPQLLIEFEPVRMGEANDAKGWVDRDRIAAMLAAATPEVK